MKSLEIVVGGQYGSEAKGHVVQRLTERQQRMGTTPLVLRVAGPNAGHTAYDADGKRWALRQVPVAAVTGGPAVIGLAAGSEIDPPVLLDEIDRLRAAGHLANKLFFVHGEATIITDDHKMQEGQLVHTIGSTGKGIGAARAERLRRQATRVADSAILESELGARGVAIATNNDVITDHTGSTIVEGTQGYALGLRAGFYPQCTSSDCTAVDFCAMAGISPWNYESVTPWVVARVYPIRVAGNSGPLRGETTWEALGLPEERTTVTQKIRRVGCEDWPLVARAVHANGPRGVRVALTMVDQKFPAVANKRIDRWSEHTPEWQVVDYAAKVREQVGAPIGMITTGPDTASWFGDGEI